MSNTSDLVKGPRASQAWDTRCMTAIHIEPVFTDEPKHAAGFDVSMSKTEYGYKVGARAPLGTWTGTFGFVVRGRV